MARAWWKGFRMAAESGAHGISCHSCPMLISGLIIQQEIGCGDQLRWQRRRTQLRSSKRALGVKPALRMLIFAANFTALGVH